MMTTTGDKIIIGALLLFSAVLFAFSFTVGGNAGSEVVITVGGQEEIRLPLDVDTVYTVDTDRGTNVIRIENSTVFMENADCPDHLCVEQGSISLTGEVIVCLPNRVTAAIAGESEEFDAVAY